MPRSATLTAASEAAAAWSRGDLATDEIPSTGWSPHATVHFINSLAEDLPSERLAELDAAFGFSATRNAEIGRAWFIQVAERRHTAAYDQLEDHLNRFGRGRLILPVYRALVENGEDGELARAMFEKARSAYHPLVDAGIAKVLETG